MFGFMGLMRAMGRGSPGGGAAAPANALKDRAGNYLKDRAGNYLVARGA